MDEKLDIRWKQRWQNFEKALRPLEAAMQNQNLSELERAGIVQYFEFAFELSWKTIKDYLEAQNVLVRFPREVIQEAFKSGIIQNGDVWMDMLEKRNLMSHTYNENIASQVHSLIKDKYTDCLTQLDHFFQNAK